MTVDRAGGVGEKGGVVVRRGVRGGDWRRPMLPGAGPLSRVHPAVAFLGVLLVFAAGIWWGGAAGALLLGLLAVGVGVLLAVAWPRLATPDRVIRVVVLLVLVGIALNVWM